MREKQRKKLDKAIIKAWKICRKTFIEPKGTYQVFKKLSELELWFTQHLFEMKIYLAYYVLMSIAALNRPQGHRPLSHRQQRDEIWTDLKHPQIVSSLLICQLETHNLGLTDVMKLPYFTHCAFKLKCSEKCNAWPLNQIIGTFFLKQQPAFHRLQWTCLHQSPLLLISQVWGLGCLAYLHVGRWDPLWPCVGPQGHVGDIIGL